MHSDTNKVRDQYLYCHLRGKRRIGFIELLCYFTDELLHPLMATDEFFLLNCSIKYFCFFSHFPHKIINYYRRDKLAENSARHEIQTMILGSFAIT